MDFFSLPCVRVHLLLQPADEPWGAERGVRLARAAEQHTVADFFENPALAKLCMDFLHGDGWALQCHCTRCKRPWLNAGWVCPVEHRRLDGFFFLDTPTASSVRGLVCSIEAAPRYVHGRDPLGHTGSVGVRQVVVQPGARCSAPQQHGSNKMDQKCIEHALGTALGPKRGPPINVQICTLSQVRWKVKAPTSPSKASKGPNPTR